MMRNLKITVSLMLAAMMLFVAGCSTADTSWGAEYKGDKPAVGVYIMGQLSCYNRAMSSVKEPDKNIFNQEVEGKKASEWIKEKTTLEMAKYFALKEKFEAAGLKLTDSQLANLNELMNSQYGEMKDLYTKNGISEQSLKDYYTNYYRSDSLFDYYYGEKGEKAVSNDEITKYFGEKYVASRFLVVPKVNVETQAMLDEAGIAAAKQKAEAYLASAKVEGTNFDDVILQWEKDNAKEGQKVHEHTQGADLHTSILPKEGSGYPAEYMEALDKAKVNEPFMAETAQYFFVAVKGDVLAKPDYLTDEYKSTIRHALRDEEFKALKDQWASEILKDVKFNEAAVKKYTAEKLRFK